MNTADLFTYLVLLISMTLAPGPLIAVTIARTLGKDVWGALSFGVGIAVGNVIIILCVRAGLGVWLDTVPGLLEYAKYLGLAYLMWIAYEMWFKTSDMAEGGKRSGDRGAMIAGMCSCFVSPHYILLYLLILPRMFDLSTVSVPVFSALAVMTFAALGVTYGGVIFMADRFRVWMVNPSKTRILNRTLATVIAGCGVWMVSI